jgi:hypothetical protein
VDVECRREGHGRQRLVTLRRMDRAGFASAPSAPSAAASRKDLGADGRRTVGPDPGALPSAPGGPSGGPADGADGADGRAGASAARKEVWVLSPAPPSPPPRAPPPRGGPPGRGRAPPRRGGPRRPHASRPGGALAREGRGPLPASLFLKQNRGEYYRLLQQVREDGDWEEFFVEGVRQTADGAVSTAQRLVALFEEDSTRIQARGRAAGSVLRVHHRLQQRPITMLQEVARATGLSFPAATSGMRLLVELGIAREVTRRRRGACSRTIGTSRSSTRVRSRRDGEAAGRSSPHAFPLPAPSPKGKSGCDGLRAPRRRQARPGPWAACV